jgi:hypothetical protein
MISHLSIVYFLIHLLLLIQCEIVQTETIKNSEKTCGENRLQTVSDDHLQVCYLNDMLRNNSILVWFTIGRSLKDLFDLYRFVLQPTEGSLSTSNTPEILTNFTQLIDLNNSLRMYKLDSGEYEVCIEFQSNSTPFIFRLRDGCISIQIGESSDKSFNPSPTPLLVALAIAIVLFFILGLVVQWIKGKRQKKYQDENKTRERSATVLSTGALKEQRDRVIRKLFHRHIDEPRPSRMRQWARNRAFRHRISTPEQEFERPRLLTRLNRRLFSSNDLLTPPRSRAETISRDRTPSLGSMLTTDNIYTISEKRHQQMPAKKILFYLSPPEDESERL